jgi:uncharacterized protein (DUF4415 family)
MKNKSLIDKDGEVRELTSKDVARAKPAQKVMPELVDLVKRSRGRPKADTTKQSVTIRLSAEVAEYFRTTGKGWQTRVDEVLQEYVRKHQ